MKKFATQMNTKLDQLEIENIEDCLNDFEESFNIKFENQELEKLNSFAAFCDFIISKIDLKHEESCTSQQAFYLLRKTLLEEKIIDERSAINPKMKLKALFPRKNRRLLISNVEKNIGFKFEILGLPQSVINFLLLSLIASLLMLFFNWQLAIVGILISILGFYLTKYGKEFEVKTVGELVNNMTTHHYLKVRSEKNTVNRSELKSVIINWFSENAFIDKEKLRNAVFV